ncbi:hypothetical protein BDR26DRAFT_722737 [Obelidium mucronatum]|nr:hypothetical protein BDR26DRAFT_722737 [Obelidium mucronatum]
MLSHQSGNQIANPAVADIQTAIEVDAVVADVGTAVAAAAVAVAAVVFVVWVAVDCEVFSVQPVVPGHCYHLVLLIAIVAELVLAVQTATALFRRCALHVRLHVHRDFHHAQFHDHQKFHVPVVEMAAVIVVGWIGFAVLVAVAAKIGQVVVLAAPFRGLGALG